MVLVAFYQKERQAIVLKNSQSNYLSFDSTQLKIETSALKILRKIREYLKKLSTFHSALAEGHFRLASQCLIKNTIYFYKQNSLV